MECTVECLIADVTIKKLIYCLNRSVAPGTDGVTVEHLVYGVSPPLCKHFAQVYSLMLAYCDVPDIFKMGIFVQILKKPTLDPNIVQSYRPIKLSSTLSKFVELLLMLKFNPIRMPVWFQGRS